MGSGPPDDITVAGDALLTALTMAEVMVFYPDVMPSGPIGGAAGSAPPGNAQAFQVVMVTHAGVRELERELREQVSGSVIERGGSDANTVLALQAIAKLTAQASDEDRAYAMRMIHGWTVQAQRLPGIDEATRWARIRLATRCAECRAKLPPPPADCGQCGEPPPLPPACPYCGTYELRLAESQYVVACFYVDCPWRDEHGERAMARLDLSALPPHGPVLRWPDGVVQGA